MTHSIAIQISSTQYEVHHFESAAHARAFIAVHKVRGARPLSNAHGRKTFEVDQTGYLGERVQSLASAIQEDRLNEPAPRVELAQAQPAQRRTYQRNGTIKVVTVGQSIGLLTPGGVVNAIVAHLGNNFVTVNVGRTERRIDVTTTGPGLTLSALVSPKSA